MPKLGLVCTTIGNGEFLEAYCADAEETGWKNSVNFYVIPDRKTPAVCYGSALTLKLTGRNVFFPSEVEQVQFLHKLGMNELVPWNSDNRRNVGYLMALEDGCDGVISIDDDNLCRHNGFFDEHRIVTKEEVEMKIAESTRKWINICKELLEVPAYPRGFPFSERGKEEPTWYWADKHTGRIAVNAGMWLQSPDLDATTWLGQDRKKLEANYCRGEIVLGDKLWSPINSQNTAISREAMAAYYYLPMGNTVNGMKIDRFGDIFQGYFLEACVKHMGEYVRFGSPAVDHVRNSHNYLKDLRQEIAGYEILDEFLEWLTEAKLDGHTYQQTYQSLSYELEDAVERFHGTIWTVDTKSYFHRVAYCMRKWLNAYCQVASLAVAGASV